MIDFIVFMMQYLGGFAIVCVIIALIAGGIESIIDNPVTRLKRSDEELGRIAEQNIKEAHEIIKRKN